MSTPITNGMPNGTGLDNHSENIHKMLQNGQLKPYVEIIEQPASNRLRFRYICECTGRSAGSIQGATSTPENKTFPAIKIHNFKGKATVVVSLVTKDKSLRAHPHNLVGKADCENGICTVNVNNDDMTVVFPNLGIQCVKKNDIKNSLELREKLKVDPFGAGFAHKNQPSSVDLNSVRLCFQVFLRGPGKEVQDYLNPVVSVPIYDKKAVSDLVITKLSHYSAPAKTQQEMILLCEKVAKEDIKIEFLEENNGDIIWRRFGEFTPSQVHKQAAIWFKTPIYDRDMEDAVKAIVYIQLVRPSDGARSKPVQFQFDIEPGLKRKRTNGEAFLNAFRPIDPFKHLQSPLPGPSGVKIKSRGISPISVNDNDQSPVIKLLPDSPAFYNSNLPGHQTGNIEPPSYHPDNIGYDTAVGRNPPTTSPRMTQPTTNSNGTCNALPSPDVCNVCPGNTAPGNTGTSLDDIPREELMEGISMSVSQLRITDDTDPGNTAPENTGTSLDAIDSSDLVRDTPMSYSQTVDESSNSVSKDSLTGYNEHVAQHIVESERTRD